MFESRPLRLTEEFCSFHPDIVVDCMRRTYTETQGFKLRANYISNGFHPPVSELAICLVGRVVPRLISFKAGQLT
jgi:hypothetical protein